MFMNHKYKYEKCLQPKRRPSFAMPVDDILEENKAVIQFRYYLFQGQFGAHKCSRSSMVPRFTIAIRFVSLITIQSTIILALAQDLRRTRCEHRSSVAVLLEL